MTITIRAATAEDHADVRALNERAVPHVNSISERTLEGLHDQCCFFAVARDGQTLAGFLLALPETAAYRSPNFIYFKARYLQFAYVDRIIVNEGFRRRGVGQKLYAALFEETRAHAPLITCEVNLDPPNPDSMLFHRNLGFQEVAQQHTEGGQKRVSLLVRSLSPA